jgi:hypothetical protein
MMASKKDRQKSLYLSKDAGNYFIEEYLDKIGEVKLLRGVMKDNFFLVVMEFFSGAGISKERN